MVHKRNNLDFEIVLVLISKRAHLREISRKLKISHSTISRRINNLLKENILDFYLEGKNKVFFLKNNLKAKNYVFLAEIYKRNKFLQTNPKLSILFEDILKTAKVELIVLFGSYAKGNFEKSSDIDIYINTTSKEVKNEIENLNLKLNAKIGKFDKSSLLIQEIIKDHIIIRGVEAFYEYTKFFENTEKRR
ncbi:MAG: nucleotidyltransferase domain-containing protein [Nanoarchaeota archaeon]|nr:nucleotidyltransferase domain-containing protein [Nanoarchaeota archaeon]